MVDQETSYGLVLSFSGLDYGASAEHAFVHGFEVGQIWQRMRSGAEAEISAMIHTINRVVIERAAAADGWDCEITTTSIPEWSEVALTKRRAAMANPHGFQVVK